MSDWCWPKLKHSLTKFSHTVELKGSGIGSRNAGAFAYKHAVLSSHGCLQTVVLMCWCLARHSTGVSSESVNRSPPSCICMEVQTTHCNDVSSTIYSCVCALIQSLVYILQSWEYRALSIFTVQALLRAQWPRLQIIIVDDDIIQIFMYNALWETKNGLLTSTWYLYVEMRNKLLKSGGHLVDK